MTTNELTQLTQLTNEELEDLLRETEWTVCNLELTPEQAERQVLLRRALRAELENRNG